LRITIEDDRRLSSPALEAKGNSVALARGCDVLVAGGGPAGLATGIAIRQRGMEVVVADALTPPIDKACGEGIMPDSRRELSRLGIDLTAGDGCEFSGIRFVNESQGVRQVASAAFGSGRGIGVRRVDLHRRLIDRARDLGVGLAWGKKVVLGGGQVTTVGGEPYRYRYLIGADGEASRVRAWAHLEAGSVNSERIGFRRHYRVAPWSDFVEVYWGDSCQVYVTPVGRDEVCVAAITRKRGLHFENVLGEFPELCKRLANSEINGRDRGAVTTTRRLVGVTRGNVALVGGASGSVDAITGEGLALSFRQALLLADALERDNLPAYEATHRQTLRLPHGIASIMMAMDRSDRFCDTVLRTLAVHPEIFASMLAVHVGERTLTRFLAIDGFRLAGGFLMAASGVFKQAASQLNNPRPIALAAAAVRAASIHEVP
jgi:flavin-dependent dehydrogenase